MRGTLLTTVIFLIQVAGCVDAFECLGGKIIPRVHGHNMARKASTMTHHSSCRDSTRRCYGFQLLTMMAKKSAPRVSSGGVKGFGGKPKLKGDVTLVKDPACDRLCRWLLDGGASIGKILIADFNGLRGVAASQTIDKGEAVCAIPMSMAIELGAEGTNPGYAAGRLLDVIHAGPAAAPSSSSSAAAGGGYYRPYLDVLPPAAACDTTDFFNEEELAATEWPPVIKETAERRALLRVTFDGWRAAAATAPPSAAATGGGASAGARHATWEEYEWAIYQIVSRTLAIYDRIDGQRRFLIPMIDMFNHDPTSPHTLKCSGGYFQVMAGRRINAGEQINIVYGGGMLPNDRLLQDYGFIQADNQHDVKQLTLPRSEEPLAGVPYCGMGMTPDQLRAALAAFSTDLAADEAALAASEFSSYRMRSAVAFRAEKKRAIARALDQLAAPSAP